MPNNTNGLTLIWLALLPEFAASFDSRFTTKFMQVGVAHNFTTNKLILKVGAMRALAEVGVSEWCAHTGSHRQLEALWYRDGLSMPEPHLVHK